MAAEEIQLDTHGPGRAIQDEIGTAAKIVSNRSGVKVGQRARDGKAHYSLACHSALPHRIGAVVTIEHGDAFGAETIENLALGLDDFFRPTEFANMSRARVGNQADIWPSQADGIGDFANA